VSVSGNPFRVLKNAINRVAKERREVAVAMTAAVKGLIEDQFGFGLDPDGKPQPFAKNKASGLMSTKLARAIKLSADANGIEGLGELKASGISRKRKAQGKAPPPQRPRRQWLNAHQKGHVFPAKSVEGQRRFFDAKGKRISAPRFKALTMKATRRVTIGAREAYWQESKNRSRLRGRILNVRSHRIGERVLVIRRIYPEPKLGARWGGRLQEAVSTTLGKQLQRNVERG